MNAEPRTGVQLERERVTCLLLINTQLMKKAINLYVNILTNQQALQLLPPQNKQSIIELYQNCTRRLHCNLAVLSTVHEKYHTTVPQPAQPNKPQFPVIMSAPPDMPELNQLYTKLQELYPDAVRFLKMKYQQLRKQAQGSPTGQMPGMGSGTNVNGLSQNMQTMQNIQTMPQNMQAMPQGMQNMQNMQNMPQNIPQNMQNINMQNMQNMPMPQNIMQQTPTYSPALSQALQPVMTPSSATFASGNKDNFMMPSQQSQFSGFNPQAMNSGYQNVSQEPQMLAMSPQQILQQANTGTMDFYS